MIWFMLAVAAGSCPFASERWVTVPTKQELPAGVAKIIGRMADKGAPFQVSDAIGPGSLPIRRFVSAVGRGCELIVRYEEGGIAYRQKAMRLRFEAGRWSEVRSAEKRKSPTGVKIYGLRAMSEEEVSSTIFGRMIINENRPMDMGDLYIGYEGNAERSGYSGIHKLQYATSGNVIDIKGHYRLAFYKDRNGRNYVAGYTKELPKLAYPLTLSGRSR